MSLIEHTDLLKKTTYYVLVCAVLMSVCVGIAAQTTSIGGVINSYARVTAISGATVTLSPGEASLMFNSSNLPDTVLLIQMTGIPVDGTIIPNNFHAGRYEFHIVTSINTGNNTVTLKSSAGVFDPVNETVQMVRVPSYKNARIDTELTCDTFKWAGGKGGVLALMVEETLTFNSSINVTGCGFNGGRAGTTLYSGPCSFSTADNTNSPDYTGGSALAGYKGEGAVAKNYYNSFPKGYGSAWNGGGGGNGRWSGGGGGANGGTKAGTGGDQYCGAGGWDVVNGIGNNGRSIKYNEINVSEYVFMGGGGGSGTGSDGTAGGNGGGIVIIVAQNLEFFNGAMIKANGSSVEGSPAEAGAGGGGGGGSILLSVENYSNIRAEMKGGNGGSVTNQVSNCQLATEYNRGAGGGGSGGFLLTSRDTTEYRTWYRNNVNFNLNYGEKGRAGQNDCDAHALPGENGSYYGDFKVQLRGFLRNRIIDSEVCYGESYNDSVTVRASNPLGGTGNYDYKWYFSTDGIYWDDNWGNQVISNGRDLKYKFTGDVWLKRVVTSGTVVDDGLPVKIKVHERIKNVITLQDTVCWKNELVIGGEAASGGGGRYGYQWEQLKDGEWGKVDHVINDTEESLSLSLSESNVIRTYQYRRMVTSGYGCVSVSDASEIVIQPVIKGNTIEGDQSICTNFAKELTGLNPTGGNCETYAYQWQISSSLPDWKNVPSAVDRNYRFELDPSGYRDRFYRRYVKSGKCESWSDPVEVYQKPTAIIKTENMLQNERNMLTGNALKYKFETLLEAAKPDIGSGAWSSPEKQMVFDAPNEPTTSVRNLPIGVNTVYWTVTNGKCVSEASIKIEVVDIFIPEGFSPNGDGKNDCFRIVGAENAAGSELIVLDRYNNVVFESKKFRGSSSLEDCTGWWDGRNKSGNELPPGVYYYQYTLDGKKVYKGYVLLKR